MASIKARKEVIEDVFRMNFQFHIMTNYIQEDMIEKFVNDLELLLTMRDELLAEQKPDSGG